jgi:hypothetical protein
MMACPGWSNLSFLMRCTLILALTLLLPALSAATLSVNLSGQSGQAFSTRLNTGDVPVGLFAFQTSGGSVDVNAVTIHFNDPAAAASTFTAVRVFFDADGNGTFDPTEEVGSAQAPNGTDDFLTFTGNFTAPAGAIRLLQVRVSVGTNVAAYGGSFAFRIDSEASIELADPQADEVTGNFPATTNSISIRRSVNQLVPGTGNPTEPRDAYFGQTNYPAMHFIVSSLSPVPPGQLDGISLESITVTITFQNSQQTEAVNRLSLWQDNGNSVFEPNEGEVLIQARTPADITKWLISGSVLSVTFDGTALAILQGIPAGSARPFWVGIDFASGIEAVCEVTVNRTGVIGTQGAAADYFVTSPGSISGDVINLGPRPPSQRPLEATGEGGCSTTELPHHGFWLLLGGLLAAFAVRHRRLVRCYVKRAFARNDTESQ